MTGVLCSKEACRIRRSTLNDENNINVGMEGRAGGTYMNGHYLHLMAFTDFTF